MKKSLAFLDHPFHQKTKSSNFFVEILEEDFDVDIFYVEDDPRDLVRLVADRGYDLIVCWQTEYCAPYFLMRGMRVLCIPMFDGVSKMPDIYWQSMRQARFVNFSRTLHDRLTSLGIESYYFQYYNPRHSGATQANFENGLQFFFWQRRPEEGIGYNLARQISSLVTTGKRGTLPANEAIHVHNAPDWVDPNEWEAFGCSSVSYFSDDGHAYKDAIARANVFICPRLTEGIGMAMLEALSRGMLVIAHNSPTANEYISHGVNGILLDFQNLPNAKLKIPDPAALGSMATKLYRVGVQNWEDRLTELKFLVNTSPRPDLRAKEQGMADVLLQKLRHSRKKPASFIRSLKKLRRGGMTGLEASGITTREIFNIYLQGVHLPFKRRKKNKRR